MKLKSKAYLVYSSATKRLRNCYYSVTNPTIRMQQGVFDLYLVAKEELAVSNSKLSELKANIETEKKKRVRFCVCQDHTQLSGTFFSKIFDLCSFV